MSAKPINPGFIHWARRTIRGAFVPEIEAYVDALARRLLPTFAAISEEADKVESDAYERLSSRASEDADPADLAQQAFDESLEYYMRMDDLKQGIINLFAAGLYHAFVQQLLVFHRYALLPFDERDNQALLRIDRAIEELASLGIDVRGIVGWDRIDGELRHIANTAKHAEGDSSNRLQRDRPDLFVKPTIGEPLRFIGRRTVCQPLIGEGLYISKEQFESYARDVVDFWGDLARILEERARISN
jgi:hypothetical protein